MQSALPMYQQAPFVQITSCYRCLKLTSHFREAAKPLPWISDLRLPNPCPSVFNSCCYGTSLLAQAKLKPQQEQRCWGPDGLDPPKKTFPLLCHPTVFKTKTSEGICIFSLYSQSCISQQSLIQPHPSTALTRTSTLSWGWPQPIFGDPKARSAFLCFVSSAWERAVTY